jgi:antitoxin VapB
MLHTSTNQQGQIMRQTAKVFTNGRSQAVRLPLEYRFSTAEVFIRRNPVSGDVILSNKPSEWQGLLDAVQQNQGEELLVTRPNNDPSNRSSSRLPAQPRRDPFEGWAQ